MADVTEHLTEVAKMLGESGYLVAAISVRDGIAEIGRLRAQNVGADVGSAAARNPSPGCGAGIVTIRLAAQIEWIDPIMIPGELNCAVLCAVNDEQGRRVIAGRWSGFHGRFFGPPFSEWRPVDPERWAYMPDFPSED